jgi:SPOR domain
MADNNFRSYRSRDPVVREGADQTARRSAGDPLAELARLIGKSDPFADSGRHETHGAERADDARSPGLEWGADDNDPEQQRPPEERYVTPPRNEPLPSLGQAPQERAYENEPPSGGRFFSGLAPRFNGFSEDDARDFPAVADNAGYQDEAQPALPTPDDRPPVLPPRQAPAFPPPVPGERAAGEIQAAEVGEAYGADDYYDDAPTPRRRGGLVLVIAVLGLAVLGTAGAFAYRAMFGGSMLPSLPPIIKAGNGPNKIVPSYGDARASNSTQATVANTGSSEKLVSREEQPVEIQEPPKTAPRVISTIPIAPNPNSLPAGASSIGAAPLAPAPAGAAPAAAPPVIATVPASPPAPAPASAEPKKIHTVTIRSDQSGGTDTGAAASAPQHNSARSAKMSAAKPSAASGSQPLSLAPDSQGDVAATPPAPVPAPPPPRSRARAAVATTTPAGGTAAETTTASGGYAVQVSSQRSEADAQAAFRALRAKFPNQLGGREPIVRRADLGAKGIYYRAMVGPFASMEEAAGMCSTLKAAGGTCLVQRN